MPARDFFVFCTSLLPLELRALGRLSEVRHLPAGQTIYAAGDASDTLYIVKRGTVAIEPGDPNRPAATTLTRGDVFGDLELLTERPRQDIARTKEPVSLQCFRREDFPDLLQRVPSFFRYLCDHLAHRLVDARHAALLQVHDLELSGSLTNFDLVTIYQTIVQSMQTGELSIVDLTGRRIAVFRFEAGQPSAGHFRHLSGEEAFWQLFLAEDLRGTFSFSSRAAKEEQSYEQTIDRNGMDLLFEAIHLRDEFQELKNSMPLSSFLELEKPAFSLGPSESEISRSLMEEIWRDCAEEPTTLAAFTSRFPVCELKVYQAVGELIRTGHLRFSEADEEEKKVA